MDFLKSAVASAIAKSSSFPVTIGDRIDVGDSIWALHNGIKKVGSVASGVDVVAADLVRTTAYPVAFSISISMPTRLDCPWHGMQPASCERCDIPA